MFSCGQGGIIIILNLFYYNLLVIKINYKYFYLLDSSAFIIPIMVMPKLKFQDKQTHTIEFSATKEKI